MMLLPSYDIIFCFRLRTIFWTDLAEIWLRGRILGADSQFGMIFFYQRPISNRYRPFLAILPTKKRQALLNNMVAMTTIQVTDEQNLYFWMLYT